MNILDKIEQTVKDADYYMTKDKLCKIICLKEKIDAWDFHSYLKILENLGKVLVDDSYGEIQVYHIAVDNPRLEKLLNESVFVK